MKRGRARAIPVPSGTLGVHFDAGAPPSSSGAELGEIRVVYRPPAVEDAQARRELVEILAKLLGRVPM